MESRSSSETSSAWIPVPPPRNWHPTYEQLAEVLRRLTGDPAFEQAEDVRRWLLLSLAFACRVACAREATTGQLDTHFGYYRLNPDGRVQIERKYRPALPIPPSLLAEMECWPEHQYVDLSHNCLYERFRRVAKELGLEGKLVPSCIRDFMAFALRHAHVDFGIPRVRPTRSSCGRDTGARATTSTTAATSLITCFSRATRPSASSTRSTTSAAASS